MEKATQNSKTQKRRFSFNLEETQKKRKLLNNIPLIASCNFHVSWSLCIKGLRSVLAFSFNLQLGITTIFLKRLKKSKRENSINGCQSWSSCCAIAFLQRIRTLLRMGKEGRQGHSFGSTPSRYPPTLHFFFFLDWMSG